MTEFNAKPHIKMRGGQMVVEYRVPSIKAATQMFPVQSYPFNSASLFGLIKESFAGAWQKNVELESTGNIVAFPAIYACISLISNDIAKLRIKLVELQPSGVWKEIIRPAFSPVLRKPNRYQTRIQFIAYWIVAKLIYGNSYVLLERDEREVVVAMYVLDPKLVTPLVAENGEVFYRLGKDNLSTLEDDDIVVPASEIIHDRMNCLFHPLVGIAPIFAAALAATQGLKIQNQSAASFEDGLRPLGVLTTPGVVGDDWLAKTKAAWNENFGPGGKKQIAVLSGGMTYVPMSIPAIEAQLTEQFKLAIINCAMPFHVPLHKLGMGQPTLNNIGALNQDYYSQALQTHIEDIELLLDEALGLPAHGYGTQLDINGLMRMDPLAQAETNAKKIGAGYLAPNEARLDEDREPLEGGDTAYLQQQYYALSDLAKRSASADPFASATPPPAPPPVKDVAEDVVARLLPALQERKIDVAVNMPADAIDKLRGDMNSALVGMEAKLDAAPDRMDKLHDTVKDWIAGVEAKVEAMPKPADYTTQLADIAKQIAGRPLIPLEVVAQFDAVNKQLELLGEKPAAPELMREIESLRKQVELSATPKDEAKDFADALISRFMQEMVSE